jgi:hypothetical protein
MLEPAAARERAPGFGQALGEAFTEAKGLFTDFAHLAVLDARRAAINLAWLLGAVLIAAVLVVTAWMGLVAAGIVWMLGKGASWILALAIAALVNIAGAGALAWWMRQLVKELPFTALLRSLKGEPPAAPPGVH